MVFLEAIAADFGLFATHGDHPASVGRLAALGTTRDVPEFDALTRCLHEIFEVLTSEARKFALHLAETGSLHRRFDDGLIT